MKKLILPITLLMSLFIGNNLMASTWFVDNSATGSKSGSSWSDAFTELQPAINAAFSSDTIWVAKGTYYPTRAADGSSADNRDMAFVMKEGVPIFGGFAGTENNFTDRATDSTSLHITNLTVLDGDLGNKNDTTDNSYHVVISAGLTRFTLDGFTIQNGNANKATSLSVNGISTSRLYGAGIFNGKTIGTYNNLIIKNNYVYSNNDASGGGAGMFNSEDSVTVSNSTFLNNKAKNCNGGAVENDNSKSYFSNVLFYKNEATGHDEGGGAIDNRNQSETTFIDVVFDGNSTENSGGAVYHDNSSPTYTNVIVKNNIAHGSGGGMDFDGGSDAVLENVQVFNNHADDDGGGLYSWKSSITLNNSVVKNNSADNDGGGMHNYSSCDPVITNTIFQGNSAGHNDGGFGLENGSTAIMTNVLIVRNKADNNGGGIGANDSHTGAKYILTNVTISNNSVKNGSGGGAYDQGTTSTIRNSLFIGNHPDEADVKQQLLLNVENTIYIDGTDTVFIVGGMNPPVHVSGPFFVDTANGNYQLVSNSVAVDKGDSSYFNTGETPDLSSITTDIRGAARIMGSNIDLGAYEYCSTTVAPTASIAATPNNSVPKGTSVTFSITSTNQGANPAIEWYKNNTQINGASGTSYTGMANVDFIDGDKISAVLFSSIPCSSLDSVISNEVSMTVTDTSTGVQELAKNNYNLNLYPNPNNGKFKVAGNFNHNKSYHITITNMLGQELYNMNVHPSKTLVEINTKSVLETGMYILSVQEEGQAKETLLFSVK